MERVMARSRCLRLVALLAVLASAFAIAPQVALAAPALTLSYSGGPPTSNVTVSGTGFAASNLVDIYWDSAFVQFVMTDGAGAFSGFILKVPATATPGNHYVTV